MRLARSFSLCALALLLSSGALRALELRGGAINTTAPGTSFNGDTFAQALPWNNVGTYNGAGMIYLGNIGNNGKYWVLTADHVAPSLPSSVTFGSTSYNTVAGSYVQLTSPDNSAADMVMFQIDVSSDPSGLMTLSLESTTPTLNTPIYYVGYGGGTKNWGYNTVAGYGHGSDGFGTIYVFDTLYANNSSNPNGAQAVLGDSGGAAFIYDATTSQWELGGMMVGVDQLPGPTTTYDMDIATYRDNILSAAIPEPGTWSLLAGGGCVIALARKRRRCA